MQNTIWKKMLFFVVLPFTMIFTSLSFVIIESALRDKNSQAELDLRSLARLDEANFLWLVNSVRMSLMTAEAELEKIDESLPDARKRGEGILLSMMENRYIYNAWLAYEPMAFDGRDPEHAGDYPGAPSGRYMRSYLRTPLGYRLALDMDESTIDDPLASSWYVAPRERGRPFIDIGPNVMYDYNTGEGELNVAAISLPIFRNGVAIGCVGADILFDQMVLDQEIFPEAVSALFSPEFGVIHAKDPGDIGKSLDSLGFRDASRIKNAFADERELYLQDDYSHFLKKDAFIYFKPMFIEGFYDVIYLCVALPKSVAVSALFPLLAPIIGSLLIALFVFVAIVHYLWRTITRPMQMLTRAADAISNGDIDADPGALNSSYEVGLIAGSLRQMAEQFRVFRTMIKRTEEKLRLYKLVNEAVFRQESIRDAFDLIVHDICSFCGAYKASLVFVTGGSPKILSRYDTESGFVSEFGDKLADFPFHGKIKDAIAGKKILFMNGHAMTEKGIEFTGWLTSSVCFLPIYSGKDLRGYFILEKKQGAPGNSGDDESLIFLAETVSYIVAQKEETAGKDGKNALESFDRQLSVLSKAVGGLGQLPEPIAPNREDLSIIDRARMIPGLDVDAGISMIGGSEEHYAELLEVSAKSLFASLEKLETFLLDDLGRFEIEAHGTKGALLNIGARELGDKALELENAAKNDDAEACYALYGSFSKSLRSFALELAAIVTKDEGPREPGDIEDLVSGLRRARECCEVFDSFTAIDILGPLARFSYDNSDRQIDEALGRLISLLENLDYDEAAKEIAVMTDMLGMTDP